MQPCYFITLSEALLVSNVYIIGSIFVMCFFFFYRTRQVLGSCVRIAPFPREVFSRVLLLFTMNVIPDDEDTTSNGQAQQL